MGCNVPNWIKSTTTDLQVCNKVELTIIFAQKSGKGNRASRLSFTAKQNMFIASKSWKPLRNQGTLAHSPSVHHCVIKAPPGMRPAPGQRCAVGAKARSLVIPWPLVWGQDRGQTWISIWIVDSDPSLVRTNSFCNLSAKTHRTKPKKQCKTASSANRSIVHSNSSTTAQPSTKCKRDKHCDLMRRRDNVFGLPSQHASQESPDTPSEHFSASSHCHASHASQDGDWDALASRVKTASQGPRFALSEHDCQTYCELRPTRRHPPACAPHPANGVQSGPNPGHWWFDDHWFGARTAGKPGFPYEFHESHPHFQHAPSVETARLFWTYTLQIFGVIVRKRVPGNWCNPYLTLQHHKEAAIWAASWLISSKPYRASNLKSQAAASWWMLLLNKFQGPMLYTAVPTSEGKLPGKLPRTLLETNAWRYWRDVGRYMANNGPATHNLCICL